MKDLIPGWKTNINTIILAILPILTLFGIQMDPQTVTTFLNDFSGWIQSGFVILGGLGIYFRNLGSQ